MLSSFAVSALPSSRWTLPDRVVDAIFAALALFGAYASLKMTGGLWIADPDIAVPAVIWDGVRQHGLAFAATWRGTTDNWLFTLVPMDAVLITLAPDRPDAVVLSGWMIFVASALFAGFIAGQIAGRRAGLRLAAVLLFANLAALGAAGFLSYPITHNVSMLWGLAAIALALGWIRRGGAWRLLLAALALALNGLSDPWSIVAVALPVALAAGLLGLVHRQEPDGRRGLALAAVAVVAAACARTHGFGAFPFLMDPPVAFASPPQMLQNAVWAFRALAAEYNVVPGFSAELSPVKWVSGFAAAAVFAGFALVALVRRREGDVATRFAIWTSIVSIAAVAAAFVAGQWVGGIYVGRFLPNLYFLGGVLGAYALAHGWRGWPRPARAAVLAWIALFMAGGVMSAPQLWTGKAPGRSNAEMQALADLLKREGLTYGYGPYWGATALSIGWLTGDRVVVRPVNFAGGRVTPRPIESSPYWYVRADEPEGLSERFVVAAYDAEQCPTVAVCMDIAVAQFGPPARVIPYPSGAILTWKKSLADSIAGKPAS
jgi:hypothetical protein